MNYEFTLAVDRDPTEMADKLFDIAEGDLVPEGGTGVNVVHATNSANSLLHKRSAYRATAVRFGWAIHSLRFGVHGVHALLATPPAQPRGRRNGVLGLHRLGLGPAGGHVTGLHKQPRDQWGR